MINSTFICFSRKILKAVININITQRAPPTIIKQLLLIERKKDTVIQDFHLCKIRVQKRKKKLIYNKYF